MWACLNMIAEGCGIIICLVSWKHHPPVVTAETTVLNQYLDGHELADPVPPEMDRQFLEAIKEVSARRMISTYYLIG